MGAIEIREAIPDDSVLIADAQTAAWSVAYRGVVPDEMLDDPAAGEIRHELWTGRLLDGPPPGALDPDNRILVPVLDGRVVGFGHAGLEAPRDGHQHRGEIYGFYLQPDAWGSGAAPVLMDACLAELRSRELDSAVLWVLEDNPRGRRFYEKTGWSATGRNDPVEGPLLPGLPPLPRPLGHLEYGIALD